MAQGGYYMNNLNQILIEGVAVSDPAVKDGGRLFCVVSKRRDSMTGEQETINVDIFAPEDIGAAANVKEGTKVRVIGRLAKSHDQNSLYTFIKADHVITVFQK
jgi:single-stranded DNA-binding protein